MLPFELLYRDFHSFEKNDELVFAKNELRHIAYSSYKTYNKKDHKFENVSKSEHKALLELLELKNIIIQKADKGNVIVIINKTSYITKINSILSDDSKLIKVDLYKKNGELDYLMDKQEEIVKFLKELKDSEVISDEIFKKMKPTGCQPGVVYGLCKVHKGVGANGEPSPFRHILSTIKTPSYNLAKFPILSELTKNKYVSKDSFAFAEIVREQNPDFFMASFDIGSLFTNVPLDETFEISVKKLFDNNKKLHVFSRQQFRKPIYLAAKNSFFLFNDTVKKWTVWQCSSLGLRIFSCVTQRKYG